MTENTVTFAKVGDCDDRWPLLTAELAAVGVRSVCSAPLVTDGVGVHRRILLTAGMTGERSIVHQDWIFGEGRRNA